VANPNSLRFDFAYGVAGTGKTAIRGGFGINYNARKNVAYVGAPAFTGKSQPQCAATRVHVLTLPEAR